MFVCWCCCLFTLSLAHTLYTFYIAMNALSLIGFIAASSSLSLFLSLFELNLVCSPYRVHSNSIRFISIQIFRFIRKASQFYMENSMELRRMNFPSFTPPTRTSALQLSLREAHSWENERITFFIGDVFFVSPVFPISWNEATDNWFRSPFSIFRSQFNYYLI